MILNNPVPASALNVDFGTLDLDTGQFTVSSVNVNGIRVRGQMNMPLILAGAIGFNAAQVTAQAVSAVKTSTCGGLFGAQTLVMGGGAKADSYDSDNGPYSGMTAGSNGNVCSIWIQYCNHIFPIIRCIFRFCNYDSNTDYPR